MTTTRYSNVNRLAGGTMLGTSTAHVDIRHAIESGRLSYTSTTLSEGERLDILAGKFYGDGKYWWILAAASARAGAGEQCVQPWGEPIGP